MYKSLDTPGFMIRHAISLRKVFSGLNIDMMRGGLQVALGRVMFLFFFIGAYD